MQIIDKMLDLVFPPTCEICGKVGTYICDDCYKTLKHYEIKNSGREFSAYKYEGKIRELLLQYKFNDKSYLHKFFAELLIKNKKACKILKSYDIIIPVPLHRKRKLERGYNQCDLIILETVKKMQLKDVKVERNVLRKIKNIKPQSTKGYKERLEDTKGAYIVENAPKISGKRVLIFDDVYTTGSTAKECARVLYKAGASQVGILTLTKD